MNKHKLVTYWENIFTRYKDTNGGFSVPGYKDPLMSPFFVSEVPEKAREYFNLIHDARESAPLIAGMEKTSSFYLGTLKLNRKAHPLEFEILSLQEASQTRHYKKLLAEGFPTDINFQKKLFPFSLSMVITIMSAF